MITQTRATGRAAPSWKAFEWGTIMRGYWIPILITLLILVGELFGPSALATGVGETPAAGARLEVGPGYLLMAPVANVLDALSVLTLAQHYAVLASLIFLFGAWRLVRSRTRRGVALRVGVELGVAVAALLALAAFYAYGIVGPRPMAAIAPTDPDVVVVDVHSHTDHSHDGRPGFDAEDRRAWHAAAGFDAVYVSDHRTWQGYDDGAPANPARAGDGTVLLPALEIVYAGKYTSALGEASRYRDGVDGNYLDQDFVFRLFRERGLRPTLVLTIPGPLDGVVPSTADAPGFVAIELSDASPRGLQQSRRDRALLWRMADSLDLAPVAATNNHGWGRTAAAWTLMRIPGWRDLTPQELGDAIETKLHEDRRRASWVVERRSPWSGDDPVSLAMTVPAITWNMFGGMGPTERVSWLVWSWLIALAVGLGLTPGKARRGAAMLLTALLVAAAPPTPVGAQGLEPDRIPEAYRADADRLIDAALADSAAWHRLAELVDRFGHRFSGSESLEQAIDWILEGMAADGLENVRGEPVMVPKWVRGRESVHLVEPRAAELAMLGLGGSIGTPAGGITAEALVVSSFDELEERATDARGKIVVWDTPFTSYGATVQYRVNGAVAAARAGAVASLVRSVASFSMNTPHTGMMRYDDDVEPIPHAAITVEDAMMLHRLQERGERIVLRLEMEARAEGEAQSRNVVAEIRGRERPDEVVVLGGHIDSWDVGQGAMDDAGGSVVAWEAVRLMKALGLRPRRTVRVVLWTNEENGLRGGTGYRDDHRDELDRHVLAIESDSGVFDPIGFGFTGSDAAYEVVRHVGTLLERIGAGEVTRGGGGADIGPIMALGVPGMGLRVEGEKYFWYHHTEADTLDKLDPREVALCTAAMAVMAYVVADLPDPLPR